MRDLWLFEVLVYVHEKWGDNQVYDTSKKRCISNRDPSYFQGVGETEMSIHCYYIK